MRGARVTIIAVCGLAAAAGAQETITIRSGSGSLSGPDLRIHAYDNPQGYGPFQNAFTPADFAAARAGDWAKVEPPEAGWVTALSADSGAKWAEPPHRKSGLMAVDFGVATPNPQSVGATLELYFAASSQLGGGPNQGVYLNGQPLSGITAGGSATTVTTISRSDISGLLVPGLNTLYLDETSAPGVPGGVLFSATIRIGQVPCSSPSWAQRTGTGPGARSAPALAYDSQRSKVVMYGGNYQGLSDTWTWDGNAWMQLPISGPPGREEHMMAYDSVRDRIVMFGGWNQAALGDTWELADTTWVQASTQGPSARASAGMAYDSARARVVLFGGSSAAGIDGDTWEWDGAGWRRVATTGPVPRFSLAMAYDASRARTVMFGGRDLSSTFGDTWEWDGTLWRQVATSGPSARAYSAMAYDSGRGRTVLYGGQAGGNAYPEAWEWDGSSWDHVNAPGPTAFSEPGLAYDAARGQIVQYGGGLGPGHPDSSETWVLGAASVRVAQQPVGGTINEGGDITLSVGATGSGPLTYHWRRNGTLLVDGGAVMGSATPTLALHHAAAALTGAYDCVVSSGCASSISNPAPVLVQSCYANCDGSTTPPVLNINDFICFQSRYAAGCP